MSIPLDLKNPRYKLNSVASSNAWTRWYANNRYVAVTNDGYIFVLQAYYSAYGNNVKLSRSNAPYDYENFTTITLCGPGTTFFPSMIHGGFCPTLSIDKKNRLHITFSGDASGGVYPHPCYMVCSDISGWNNAANWQASVITTDYCGTMQSCLDYDSDTPIVYVIVSSAGTDHVYGWKQDSEMSMNFTRTSSRIFQNETGAFYPDCLVKDSHVVAVASLHDSGYPLLFQRVAVSDFLDPTKWKDLYGTMNQCSRVNASNGINSITANPSSIYVCACQLNTSRIVIWLPTDEFSPVIFEAVDCPDPFNTTMMQATSVEYDGGYGFVLTSRVGSGSSHEIYAHLSGGHPPHDWKYYKWYDQNTYNSPIVSVPNRLAKFPPANKLICVDATSDWSLSGMGCGTFDFKWLPPTVLYTSPEDAETDVKIGTNILVKFSQPMNPDIKDILLFPAHALGFFWKSDDELVVSMLSPNKLLYDTLYQCTVEKSFKDVYGTEMDEDYEFSFTSEKEPDDVKTGVPSYDIEVYKRHPDDEMFRKLTDVKFNEASVEEQLDDGKTISIKMSSARNSMETYFPFNFRQGDDLLVVIKYMNTVVYTARGFVVDNIDSEKTASGIDDVVLHLRGILATLDNCYSPISTRNNMLANALSMMTLDTVLTDGDEHRNSIQFVSSVNDSVRDKHDDIDSSITSRATDLIALSTSEAHLYERDDIVKFVSENEVKVKTYLKLLKLDFNAEPVYAITDYDMYAGTRKTPRAKYSGSLSKSGTRFVVNVYENFLKRLGRRDIKEEDREIAKLIMIRDINRDEEISLLTNKPFNFRLGDCVELSIKELQFFRKSFLTARTFNVTPNSFECRLSFNVIPKPMIAEMKDIFGLK